MLRPEFLSNGSEVTVALKGEHKSLPVLRSFPGSFALYLAVAVITIIIIGMGEIEILRMNSFLELGLTIFLDVWD